MQEDKNVLANAITLKFLSTLDRQQLIDMLAYKTFVLVTARANGKSDHGYIKKIQKEVELIQAEIKARNFL